MNVKKFWSDSSSYSRDEKERIPKEWTLETGFLKICIHRHIHFDPKTWLLSCHELGISRFILGEIDTKQAQDKAIDIIKLKLKKMADSLEGTR